MVIEDKFPDRFKRNAYHPSAYVYAWKRKDLEKLFEEIMQSNIAIKGGEAWRVEDESKITRTIPLKSGQIKVFEWKFEPKEAEQWYDFVERSAKETLELTGNWDLEHESRPDISHKIWFHIDFWEPD